MSFKPINIKKKKTKKKHFVYNFCDVLSKIKQFLNLFVNKLFGGSLKMPTIYCVTKSEKNTPHFSKIWPRELSFHTIHLYKKKNTWYINIETIHCKLTISWTYSEINLAASHNPQNQLPRLFKTVCNKLFFLKLFFDYSRGSYSSAQLDQ